MSPNPFLRKPRPVTRRRRTIDEVARAYLANGGLTIEAIDESTIRATCRGRRGLYDLGYDADRGWWCSCNIEDECPHLAALRLVTRRR